MTDAFRASIASQGGYQAKSFGTIRKAPNVLWDGFADSNGINAARCANYSVDTSAKCIKATTTGGGAISGATGTEIGNMSPTGVAFNGVTNASNAGATAIVGQSGYVGKTYSGGKRITSVACYGTNNYGYVPAGGSVTLALYGKTGAAPANATDGTLLATSTFTTSANESTPRTLTSSDPSTLFDHVWVRLTSVANDTLLIVEVIFTETGATANLTYSSTLQTADAAVTTVTALFEIDTIDAITLGTDLTGIATCNSWANNGAVTLSVVGKGQSGRTICKAVATGLVSGTGYALELVYANNKNAPIHFTEVRAA